MNKSFSDSYAAAGVDVTAGYKSVELIKSHVKKTVIPGVIGGIGGFGGMFELPLGEYKNPVLVSGTDGVGTKLKLAFLLDKHDTIGIDCVAMCVNDVACSGAKPLFFLDYIACGKNYPEKIEQIVKGVADGCVLAGCALVGGETAEHPGLMPDEDYDLAGFTVGIGEKDKCFKKPIFDLIQKCGNIPERDMYNTFNMGTGIILAVDSDKADEAVRILNNEGEKAAIVGEIRNGEKGVELI